MPQPFGKNSTVIGTSFNESAIMDRVMEKMSKLNATSNMNQSMNNNTSLNQSVSTPQRPARRIAPPQLIRPTPTPTPRLLLKPRPTPSAIQFSTVPMQFLSPAPSSLEPPQLPRQAAPSTIAPASPSVEAFNLLSLAPEPARSQIEPVSEEFISASSRAAEMSKEELLKIFGNMSTNDMDVIINTTFRVGPILKGKNKSGQSSSFISKFKEIYQGGIGQQTAASKAWKFYRQINQI
jgi:hypothetical protein